jgi:hypothetical protein
MPDLGDFLDHLDASSDPAEMAAMAIFGDIKGRKGLGNAIEDSADESVIDMIKGWVSVIRDGA